MLTIIVDYELRSISIRLEAELLCDEAQIQVRFVTRDWLVGDLQKTLSERNFLRFADVAESSQTLPNNEHIHEISPHVGSVHVKSEEFMVVAQGEGRAYI